MLKEFFTGTKLGCATVVKDVLTVYPVIGSNGASEPDCVTLGEAIQTGAAAVREVEEGATVPDVDVTVAGERPLLVVEGEVLEGGKQRRMVNISLILPKGKHRMPVSCIEAGRWGARHTSRHAGRPRTDADEGTHFQMAEFNTHSRLRRESKVSMKARLLRSGQARPDQGKVWEEVSEKLEGMGVSSRTSDAGAVYEHHGESIRELIDQIEQAPGQVGAVVAIGDKIVGMDAFNHPDTWKKMSKKVLSGYAADALEALRANQKVELPPIKAAEGFIKRVAEAPAQVVEAAVGVGEHHLLEGGVDGFALVADGTIRHLFAYPT